MLSAFCSARRRAFRAQSGCCCYCGQAMWETHKRVFALKYRISARVASNFRSTAEHLIARVDGGSGASNIAAACEHCNHKRHAGRARNAPSSAAFAIEVRQCIARGEWEMPLLELDRGLPRKQVTRDLLGQLQR